MLDVVGETLDGLVLKGLPKDDTLEANLNAYTKPNLIQLAEANDFEVKKSWNKGQMIEVISEGLRDSLDERLSDFEDEELETLREIADGNNEQVEAHSELIASAVNKGLLYVTEDNDTLSFSMPSEFEAELDEAVANDESAEAAEEPVVEVASEPRQSRQSARTVPYSLRRQRRKPVVQQRIVGEKIGRNDPCPCGSGKKYKKCCLRKAQ